MITLLEYYDDINKYKLNRNGLGRIDVSFSYANGCGAKGGVKFPDTMWFVLIISACIGHDVRWALAKCFADLVEANEIFDNDLKKICDYESNTPMQWVRRQRIAKYISGVELKGIYDYAEERGFEAPERPVIKPWWRFW